MWDFMMIEYVSFPCAEIKEPGGLKKLFRGA